MGRTENTIESTWTAWLPASGTSSMARYSDWIGVKWSKHVSQPVAADKVSEVKGGLGGGIKVKVGVASHDDVIEGVPQGDILQDLLKFFNEQELCLFSLGTTVQID